MRPGVLIQKFTAKPSLFVAFPIILVAAAFMAFDLQVIATILLAAGIAAFMIDLVCTHGLDDQSWWLAGTAIFMAGIIIAVGTGWQGGWWITAIGMFFPQGRNLLKRKA